MHASKTPAATPPAGTSARSIRRTAGYGPVCPVVWEGWSRETPPYPDRPRNDSHRVRGERVDDAVDDFFDHRPVVAFAHDADDRLGARRPHHQPAVAIEAIFGV